MRISIFFILFLSFINLAVASKFSLAYLGDVGYNHEQSATHNLNKVAIILNFKTKQDVRSCYISVRNLSVHNDIAFSISSLFMNTFTGEYTLSFPKTLYGPITLPGSAGYTLSTRGIYDFSGKGVVQLDFRHETIYFGSSTEVSNHINSGGYSTYVKHKVKTVLNLDVPDFGDVLDKEVSFENNNRDFRAKVLCHPF